MDKVKNPVKGKGIDISFKINRPVKYLSTRFLRGYDKSEENKKFIVKAKLGLLCPTQFYFSSSY